MFSIYHFIWLAIAITLIVLLTKYLLITKPEFSKVLSVCCVVCIISELIKMFSQVELIPSKDGSMYFPYLSVEHLPFHLCSLQIILIFFLKFGREGKVKDAVMAFMFPTCLIGPMFALAIPTIWDNQDLSTFAFLNTLSYQYFLYHVMLIVLAIYIGYRNYNKFTIKDYFVSVGMLLLIAIIMIYVNSALAHKEYINGELVSVEFVTNFFFIFKVPIGIPLTEIWHWYLYVGILIVLVIVLLGLAFLPFIIHNKKKETYIKID
jgi:uncharacterized membrane protein YwaF